MNPILYCFFSFFVLLIHAEESVKAAELPTIPKIPVRAATYQPESNFHDAGLFFCQIPKSGATIMHTILCDLYRYYKGIPFKINYSNGKETSDCQKEHWYGKPGPKHNKWTPNPEDTRIAVIRNPMKRFISLYEYLCDRFQMCGTAPNIHRFTRDVYTLLTKRSTAGTSFKDSDRDVIEYHAQPQTWFCILSANADKFHLVRNEGDRLEMRRQLQTAFEEAKIPKFYSDQVLFHVVYSDTAHANHSKDQAMKIQESLEQNPQSMAYFDAIYYTDFQTFSYRK